MWSRGGLVQHANYRVRAASDDRLALLEGVEPALVAVEPRLPVGFPPALWEKVAQGMRAQARAFCAP